MPNNSTRFVPLDALVVISGFGGEHPSYLFKAVVTATERPMVLAREYSQGFLKVERVHNGAYVVTVFAIEGFTWKPVAAVGDKNSVVPVAAFAPLRQEAKV